MFGFLSLLHAALVLTGAPAFASRQLATPEPECPGGWYPAVGALEIDEGEVEWFLCSPAEAYRTILGVGDVVLVQEATAEAHHVIALDPADGSELWRRATGFIPVAGGHIDSQGVVLLSVGDATSPALIGVESETGKELWRIESGEVPLAHGANVTIVGDAASRSGQAPVRGIDRLTGQELWVSKISLSDSSGQSVGRSPVAMDGDIAVVPTGETVSGIDVRTGELLWEAPRLSHIVIADVVVVGSEGGGRPGSMIAALDADSGERLWSVRGDTSYGGFIAVGDGVAIVMIPGQGELAAIELGTGAERWRSDPDVHVEPQLATGTAVVPLWEAEIAAFSTTDGTIIWSATRPFGSPLMNSVGTNGELVIVGINSRPWGD